MAQKVVSQDVVLQDVWKSFGGTPAVRGVSLHVAAGEFVTLLGPSGCGKTTCLRMVAGFVEPDRGRIVIGDADVTTVPAHRRDTGMVFQSYALFPHKTVAANVGFGLKMRHLPRGAIAERVREALRLVHMEDLAERYPAELSGGQRQRVALARAVVIRPKVLLLDEPLGALDLKLREELQVEIKRVQSELGITTLFVTHDQGEALGLSDRVAVMRAGEIVQIDIPAKLYERPNCEYVANFVGRTNLVEVEMVARDADGTCRVRSLDDIPTVFTVIDRGETAIAPGERCLLAARPEHVRVTLPGGTANTIVAEVIDLVYRGSLWHVELRGPRGESFSTIVYAGTAVPHKGEHIELAFRPTDCFLLKRDPTDPKP